MHFKAASGISAATGYLPAEQATTTDLFTPASHILSRNPRYVQRVTGVQTVHVAEPNTLPSSLALEAIEQALTQTGIAPSAIGAIIYAGMCRDYEEPDTALVIAKALGISPPIAFDAPNACHGFATAIMLADNFIRVGAAEHVLICAGELGYKRAAQATEFLERQQDPGSKLAAIHPNYTVGDAGAAMIMTRPHNSKLMLDDYRLVTEPDHYDACTIENSTTPAFMDGPFLKQQTMRIVREELSALLADHGCVPDDIARYIVHQTGLVTIREYQQFLGVTSERVVNTVQSAGNLVSCTLPIGLSKILSVLSPDERVVFSIQGSGLTSSAWMARMT